MGDLTDNERRILGPVRKMAPVKTGKSSDDEEDEPQPQPIIRAGPFNFQSLKFLS